MNDFTKLLVMGPLVWGADKYLEKKKAANSRTSADEDHVIAAKPFGSSEAKPRRTLNDGELAEIIFTALLLKAAAVCDGSMKPGEMKKIREFIDQRSSEFLLPEKFEQDYAVFQSNFLTINDLRDYYRAIPEITQEKKDYWLSLVNAMLREDQKINDAENAFLFGLKMFFLERKIPVIYRIVEEPYQDEKFSINFITREDVSKKYQFTDPSKINSEQFYIPHPSGIKELVSFDYLLEQSFASSKHTELIEVARQAGAKSIQIMSAEKNSQNSNIDASAGGSFRHPSQFKVSGSASFSKKGFSDAELKSGIFIEFQGNRAQKDKDWLGRTAQQILRESRWLAFDGELTTFVHNCFGENRVMRFELEVDVSDVQQASVSASIAAECDMAGMAGGSAEANFGKSKEQSKLTHVKYVIDFE